MRARARVCGESHQYKQFCMRLKWCTLWSSRSSFTTQTHWHWHTHTHPSIGGLYRHAASVKDLFEMYNKSFVVPLCLMYVVLVLEVYGDVPPFHQPNGWLDWWAVEIENFPISILFINLTVKFPTNKHTQFMYLIMLIDWFSFARHTLTPFPFLVDCLLVLLLLLVGLRSLTGLGPNLIY